MVKVKGNAVTAAPIMEGIEPYIPGFLAYYFAVAPQQWDMLRADISKAPNAVEEAVRLATQSVLFRDMLLKILIFMV